MIVVSDTGPLNCLVLIGTIDLVPALYGHLLVPDAVAEELRHPDAPPSIQSWISQPPSWVAIEGAAVVVGIPGLDPGEEAAISLAQERRVPGNAFVRVL